MPEEVISPRGKTVLAMTESVRRITVEHYRWASLASVALLTALVLPAVMAGGAVAVPRLTSISFAHSGHSKGGGGGSCTGGSITAVTDSNWAGYAAETCLSSPSNGVVNSVQGSWVEPSVSCTAGTASYSAFWVGIDGYSSRSVEQIGTDSDCTSAGAPSYYAWYEMYPKMPVNLALTISPGDTLQASVVYQGAGSFLLTINDLTSKMSFSTHEVYKKAARSSAEWVAEAPSGGSVLPLADFGSVTFTSCTATFGSTSGPIQDPAWQSAQMDMVTSSGALKASTSGLSSGGESFTTTWEHS